MTRSAWGLSRVCANTSKARDLPLISTLNTRAPSLANNAAKGLPTTSLRLMTVMTFPLARSPHSRSLL